MKHYYFYTHHHSKINRLTSKEIYEPPHDKTNKVSVRPAKTQISLASAQSDPSLRCPH